MKNFLIIILSNLLILSYNKPVFSARLLHKNTNVAQTNNVKLREWWNKLELDWKWVFLTEIKSNYKTPTDKELKYFTQLNKLSRDSIHLRSLDPIKDFYSLKILEVPNTEIVDISALKNLFKLQKLVLNANDINSIKVLSRLKNLKVLNLSLTKVTNLNPLENLSNLEEIYLNETNIESLKPLYKLKKLKKLSIIDSKVNKNELEQFKKLYPKCLIVLQF